MSRPVSIYKLAALPPFVCARCRVAGEIREYMVDMGVTYEFEGVVYFCNACLKDVIDIIPDAITKENLFKERQEFLEKQMELMKRIERADALEAFFSKMGVKILIDEDENGTNHTTTEFERISSTSEPESADSGSGEISAVSEPTGPVSGELDFSESTDSGDSEGSAENDQPANVSLMDSISFNG